VGRVLCRRISLRNTLPRRLVAESAPGPRSFAHAYTALGDVVPREIRNRIFDPFFTTKRMLAPASAYRSQKILSRKTMGRSN
jgi:hypothetical protein